MSTSQPPNRPRKRRTDRLIGATLAGKYRILKKIGEGGMGSVYTALQDPIDRKVAVKVLLGNLAGDDVAVRRFEQEARAISKMQHPNTVTIYDFGRTEAEDDDRLYIVMEYLKGQTLMQVLRAEGVLAPPRACRIMRQVCASLADAHAAGIIHRDLKPDNVFLTEVGGDRDWVKVLDFGVAKLADSEGAGTLTQTGMIFGTPKYMSPEQAEGRPIDYRADIYAIGVVLYELLVGKPPFVADTPVGLLLKHISEPPTPFAEARPDLQINPEIEAVVMRALAKLPEGRPQRVVELGLELEAFERRTTGLTPAIASGTYPTPVAPGLPTEVEPGTMPGPARTPVSIAPPQEVPPGLSDGLLVPPSPSTVDLVARTEDASPASRHQGPDKPGFQSADLLPTASREPVGADVHGAASLTHPTPVAGGGLDTLGGEVSGPLPRSRRGTSRSGLRFVGIGFLGAAAVLAVVAAISQDRFPVEKVSDTVSPLGVASESEVRDAPNRPMEGTGTTVDEPDRGSPESSTREPREAPRPQLPPGNRRAATPSARPPARLVTVRFESIPKGAMVRLEGKQLGMTPFEQTFPRGDEVLVFSFEKQGFVTKKSAMAAVRDRTVSVTLPRHSTSGRAKPRRRKPPKKPPEPDSVNERVGDLKGF